jgi:thiamine-phosphate pyrophosphorylase
MPEDCILYYITDRQAFPGDEPARRAHLLNKIAEAATAGVHYIQLREKDLTPRELESLARDAAAILKLHSPATTLLINSRSDIAVSANAAGVHLPSNDISPADVRTIFKRASAHDPIISLSCHSAQEVAQAANTGADLALFAPVFEKKDAPSLNPQGLAALHQAVREKIPVLALGGVTLHNAAACLASGASGIAAIRLFQENEIAAVVRRLRNH